MLTGDTLWYDQIHVPDCYTADHRPGEQAGNSDTDSDNIHAVAGLQLWVDDDNTHKDDHNTHNEDRNPH